MNFGERLKVLRIEFDLSQSDFGKKFNKSANNISQYETGKRQPDIETLYQISDFFHVSLDYLLGKSNLRENSNPTPKEVTDNSELTTKNKKDIAKKMQALRSELSTADGLMFDGDIMSDETKELLLHLLEKDEIAATINNKKYIPKKHRK